MKSNLIKLSLAALTLTAVIAVLHSEPSNSAATTHENQDGRYKLSVVSGTYGVQEFVIDTQSGRVWHTTLDAQKGLAVFVTATYENVSGDLSTIPNEVATTIKMRSMSVSTNSLP
jgi:hypothetical protein